MENVEIKLSIFTYFLNFLDEKVNLFISLQAINDQSVDKSMKQLLTRSTYETIIESANQ